MTTPRKRAHVEQDLTPSKRAEAELCSLAIRYVKEKRPYQLTLTDRLDILHMQAVLRLGTVNLQDTPCAIMADLLGRAQKTIKEIWKEFKATGELVDQPLEVSPSRPRSRVRRIATNPTLLADLRAFIRQRAATRQRTVAKDVLSYFVAKSYIKMIQDDQADYNAALRCVQRFIAKQGYKRGKRKGVYRLSSAHAVLRDDYVLKMAVDPGFQQRRKVYIDESYIHHHHKCHQDALYDPTDPNSTREKHKGRRLCIIAAIIDDDPNPDSEVVDGLLLADAVDQELDRFLGIPFPVGEEEEHIYAAGVGTKSCSCQLLMDTVKFFEGSKQTKDYHGMFNHPYFEKWMKRLLGALAKRGIKNCVIVMDNAKYHKVLPDDVPKKKDAKAKLLKACETYGLIGSDDDTKLVLWERLQAYIKQHVSPVIVKMAEDAGHTVIFTPPHFSDLQPIELVWAAVKGDVGRQYTTETTFADVRTRLVRAFGKVSPDTVRKCIQTANQNLYDLMKHIRYDDKEDVSSQSSEDECNDGEMFEEGSSSDSGSASDDDA